MRASDRAYSALRTEILEWHLAPGTVLAEVEQAARRGVSRTPLREALARRVVVASDVVGECLQRVAQLREGARSEQLGDL